MLTEKDPAEDRPDDEAPAVAETEAPDETPEAEVAVEEPAAEVADEVPAAPPTVAETETPEVPEEAEVPEETAQRGPLTSGEFRRGVADLFDPAREGGLEPLKILGATYARRAFAAIDGFLSGLAGDDERKPPPKE